MESIDSLAKAINQFSGGMVLVSHDMRLISQVTIHSQTSCFLFCPYCSCAYYHYNNVYYVSSFLTTYAILLSLTFQYLTILIFITYLPLLLFFIPSHLRLPPSTLTSLFLSPSHPPPLSPPHLLQVAKEIWMCDNRTVSKFQGDISDFKMQLRRQMQLADRYSISAIYFLIIFIYLIYFIFLSFLLFVFFILLYFFLPF